MKKCLNRGIAVVLSLALCVPSFSVPTWAVEVGDAESVKIEENTQNESNTGSEETTSDAQNENIETENNEENHGEGTDQVSQSEVLVEETPESVIVNAENATMSDSGETSQYNASEGTSELGGAGTHSNPYRISNSDDFKYFLASIKGNSFNNSLIYYKLTGNINMNGDKLDADTDCSNQWFQAHLDGDNHTISNFTLNDRLYLFKYIESTASVENLTFKDFVYEIPNAAYSGQTGLLAYQNYGAINNVNLDGNIKINVKTEKSTMYLGGLIGNNSGEVKNCSVLPTAKITIEGGKARSFGGLVCYNKSYATTSAGKKQYKFSNCNNEGEIIIDHDMEIGGVVYTNSGELEKCSFTGKITTPESGTNSGWTLGVGGIAYSNSTGAYMSNCISDTEELCISHGYLGGVTYDNSGTISECTNNINLKGASSSSSYCGGIVGRNNAGVIEYCTNNGILSGGCVGGIAGLNKESGSIRHCDNYANLTAGSYSKLGGICGDYEASSQTGGRILACKNHGELSAPSGSLVGGIVGHAWSSALSITEFEGKYAEYVVIEECRNEGTIADGYAVGGIVGKCEANHGGLMVKNCTNAGIVNGSVSGGIAGYSDDRSSNTAEAKGFAVSKCTNTGDVTGSQDVGGIVGEWNLGMVTDCANTGSVTTKPGNNTKCGGIAGKIGPILAKNTDEVLPRIMNSYNTGQVKSASGHIGGIVGDNGGGYVSRCFNMGEIIHEGTTMAYVGGLVGYAFSSERSVSIKDCYNIGEISVSSRYDKIGGIAAHVSISPSSTAIANNMSCTVSNCYIMGMDGAIDAVLASDERAYVGNLFSEVSSEIVPVEISHLYYLDSEHDHAAIAKQHTSSGGSININDIKAVSDAELRSKDTFNDSSWKFFDSYDDSATEGWTMLKKGAYKYPVLINVGLEAMFNSGDPQEGVIGNIIWSIEDDVLTISGFGDMPESGSASQPWSASSKYITKIVVENSVTGICSSAFKDFGELNSVVLSSNLKYIGDNAFASCKKLAEISLPLSLERLGKNVFEKCGVLRRINYMGTSTQWSYVIKDKGFDDNLKKNLSAVNFTDNKVKGYFQYVSYEEGNNRARYGYDCNFNWFGEGVEGSYKYQHDLARMSLKTAMAGFATADEAKASEDIRWLMESLGFEYDDQSIKYDKSSTQAHYDNIGYAIGSREIEVDGKKSSLILVTIRGAGYGAEWGGNFNVGTGIYNDHEGFSIARNKVKKGLEDYIGRHPKLQDNKLKIWIVGYSRAAATANLLGSSLDRGELIGAHVNPKDVYTYCFECPQNTTSDTVYEPLYDNIYSVVNTGDLVPMVAPSLWHFTRYGRTFIFPTWSNTKNIDVLLSNRNSAYVDILSYKPDPAGEMTNLIQSFYNQDKIFKELIDKVAIATKDRSLFAKEYQPFVQDMVVDFLTKVDVEYSYSTGEILWAVLAYVLDSTLNNDPVIAAANVVSMREFAASELLYAGQNIIIDGVKIKEDVLIGDITKNLNKAHYPELCLAWMESIDAARMEKDKGYREIYINCPVDVTLTTDTGEVIGKIVDDKPVVIGEIARAYVDGNGQKVVMIPLDADYNIDMLATDDGTVSYTVAEYVNGEGIPSKVTCYEEMSVTEDEHLKATLGEGIEQEAECTVARENGTVIEPNAVLTGDEIEQYMITVNKVGDAGDCEGGGYFIPGEFAQLTARTYRKDSDFQGWFINGELVSSDKVYRFPVTESVEIEARFVDAAGKFEVLGVDEGGYEYTGSAVKPAFKVYDGLMELKEKTDYTLTYKNNTNVYTYKEGDPEFNPSKAPCVVVTGKGNYKDKATVYFTINPRTMGDGETLDEAFTLTISDKAYTGKKNLSKPTIKYGKLILKENKDYTLSYSDDVINPGKVTVTITGMGNYTGEATAEYKIYDKSKDFSKVVYVTAVPNQTYTGSAVIPSFVVRPSKNSAETYVEGVDYQVEYTNNINVGTATAMLTGLGQFEEYGNGKKVTFKIVAKDIKNASINVTGSTSYTGSALKPSVEVRDADTGEVIAPENYSVSYSRNTKVVPEGTLEKNMPLVKVSGKKNYKGSTTAYFMITPMEITESDVTISISDVVDTANGIAAKNIPVTIKRGKTTLKKGTDYTVDYTRDMEKINQMATITFMGNYTGSIDKKFRIHKGKIPMSGESISINLPESSFEYTGSKITALVEVRMSIDGEEELLTEGKDYKLSYGYNVNAAASTVKKAPYVKVTGIGIYTGTSKAYTFEIKAKELKPSDVTVTVSDIKYTGKALKPKCTVTNNLTGKKMGSSDYTVSYVNNVNLPVSGTDAVPNVVITGKGNYAGSISQPFRIYRVDMSSLQYDKVVNAEYTGKQIAPKGDSIKVYADKRKSIQLTEGVDYVLSYGANTKVGKGTVTITGLGDYGGSKTLSFTIVPKWMKWVL